MVETTLFKSNKTQAVRLPKDVAFPDDSKTPTEPGAAATCRIAHELERYMRCRQCSEVRGYAYKRSHLVALRPTKITASDPPSTWWPGER